MNLTLPSGDLLEQDRNRAILRFCGPRKVLCTTALNGGLHRDLTAVYNYNDCPRAGKYCEMQGETMEEHQRHTARAIGLEPTASAGLHTAANIDNAAIRTLACGDYSVTAIVTAGIEVNACRVGSPAALDERDGKIIWQQPGTINIILSVSADLSDGCITRALVTCTEAKVAALQELVVSDRYTSGLATGSGTDGTIIVASSDSAVHLNEAGESFRLGELIGRAVMQAVKEALYRQSGLCAGMQHSVFRRLERFGVTEPAVWARYRALSQRPVDRERFGDLMFRMTTDGSTVTAAALYAHLIDQAVWGMLLPQEAAEMGDRLLYLMGAHHGMTAHPRTAFSDSPEKLARNMAETFIEMVAQWTLDSET